MNGHSFKLFRRDVSERVATLRQKIAREHLDGFIFPNKDEFQSEYTSPHRAVFQWITGLDIAGGICLISIDSAVLIVAERYVEQARSLCSHSFEVFAAHELSVSTWLCHQRHRRIGFNRLICRWQFVKSLQEAAPDVILTSIEGDPVTTNWPEEFPSPGGELSWLPEEASGAQVHRKIEALRQHPILGQVDLLVITNVQSVSWLLNMRSTDIPYLGAVRSALIISRSGPPILALDPDRRRSVLEQLQPPFSVIGLSELEQTLADPSSGGRSVAFDPATAPYNIVDACHRAGATVLMIPDPTAAMRLIKSPAELAGMREAGLRDSLILCRTLFSIESSIAGMALRERDVLDLLNHFKAEMPSRIGDAFPPIIAFGPNSASIHYDATSDGSRTLRAADILLIDFGSHYDCGTSDITRTLCHAEPDRGISQTFTYVLKSLIAAVTGRYPNSAQGSDVDFAARSVLDDAGLLCPHGIGHSIGHRLSVHEEPLLFSRASKIPLIPSLVATIEPGYYRPKSFGVRIENVVEVKEQAGALTFDVLSFVPISRPLIDISLLNASEIEWLDHYHARVRDALDALIPSDMREWLYRETLPLIGH